jgi:hypothetical protein
MIGLDDPEYGHSMEEAHQAAANMLNYAANLRQERRQNPKNDLVSVLMEAEVGEEPLTDMEFNFFFLLSRRRQRDDAQSSPAAPAEIGPARRAADNPARIPTAVEDAPLGDAGRTSAAPHAGHGAASRSARARRSQRTTFPATATTRS